MTASTTAPQNESGGAPHTARKVVPHPTVAERVARGKSARREVPRSSHAAFAAGPARANDPLFLRAKEAQASVLASFAGPKTRVSDDERVVNGQHLMQATSDIFLGWCSPIGFDGVQRDYSLRQLRDRKGSAVVETMDPSRLEMYARLCGRALARAHARSGDRIAISAHLGTSNSFDDAIADFSESYADRNEADYQVLLEAQSSDRTPREDQHRSGGIRMP